MSNLAARFRPRGVLFVAIIVFAAMLGLHGQTIAAGPPQTPPGLTIAHAFHGDGQAHHNGDVVNVLIASDHQHIPAQAAVHAAADQLASDDSRLAYDDVKSCASQSAGSGSPCQDLMAVLYNSYQYWYGNYYYSCSYGYAEVVSVPWWTDSFANMWGKYTVNGSLFPVSPPDSNPFNSYDQGTGYTYVNFPCTYMARGAYYNITASGAMTFYSETLGTNAVYGSTRSPYPLVVAGFNDY